MQEFSESVVLKSSEYAELLQGKFCGTVVLESSKYAELVVVLLKLSVFLRVTH